MKRLKPNMAHKIPLKRVRTERKEKETNSDSEYESFVTSKTWQRFLAMKSAIEEAPLHKLSLLAVQNGFQAIAGTPESTKRLRDGSLLVECNRNSRAVNLLKTTCFVERPVHVSAHKTSDSSRGVIRCRELCGMMETETRDELKDQGVVGVHRVTVKRVVR